MQHQFVKFESYKGWEGPRSPPANCSNFFIAPSPPLRSQGEEIQVTQTTDRPLLPTQQQKLYLHGNNQILICCSQTNYIAITWTVPLIITKKKFKSLLSKKYDLFFVTAKLGIQKAFSD